MKFQIAAANGLATGAFQKYNWDQIDPMVDTGLNCCRVVFIEIISLLSPETVSNRASTTSSI